MGNIQNKVIQIKEISNKNGRYSLRDSQGNLYSFFQSKSGTKENTQAYDHLMTNNHNEQFNQGDTALIGYTETPGTTRDGQPTTYKNIISMMPSNEQPSVPSAPKEPTYIQERNESREAFGKRLALHGMVNGMLAAGKTSQQVIGELPQLIDLEDQIERILTI